MLHSLLQKKEAEGSLDEVVEASASTCKYTRFSKGILASPFAFFLRLFSSKVRAVAELTRLLVAVEAPAALDLPHALSLSRAFWAWVRPAAAGRAPRGVSVEHECSSFRRCLRQYERLHVGHCTPTEVWVCIRDLHCGCEHCVPVTTVGFWNRGVVEEYCDPAARRATAHAPKFGQA